MFTNGQEVKANIYCIKHEGHIIYVGCTIRLLEERLMEHLGNARKSPTSPFYKFLLHNRDVEIELIEEVMFKYDERFCLQPALAVETYWISFYQKEGYRLYNRIIKGKLSPNYNPETSTKRTCLSANLRYERKRKNLTQQQVSDILNIKRSTIGSYEEARADPSTEVLIKFCELFGISDIKEMFKNRVLAKSNIKKAA